MKHFNKIIIGIVCFWLLLAFSSSYFICSNYLDGKNKGYAVDINRINAMITEGKRISDIDISQFTYVKDISRIDLPITNAQIQDFFKGKGLKRNLEYQIQPVLNGNNPVGYIRFGYETDSYSDKNQIVIIYNICLVVMVITILLIMVYIRRSVLKPFNEIIELPYELSKGHLNNGLKESKNRFFGRFLWGLDLLRENLELHKRREIQLQKEKKTMILSISHDIKTPLSTIKLYSKAIYDDLYNSDEKRIEAAKHIEDKANQIEGFVSEIIATSTEDILDIQVNSGEFYLSRLIAKINKTYCEKLKLIKTDFSFGSYEDILLKGDIERLIEVFENIIENAIKYGDGRSIRITFSDEDYCKLITVTNTGTPVPRTEFIHMFESFWRGANAHAKEGSGLGLYICKEIMKKMNGDIFAQSTENTMSIAVVVRYSN
jgi:signal transduction histidine kinase